MIKEAWAGLLMFVQEINTTSSRILVSLLLSSIIVLVTLTMMVLKIPIDVTVLIALCGFVATLGGLDVIQFTQKRKSFKPEIIVDPTINVDATVANRAIGDEHGVEFTN